MIMNPEHIALILYIVVFLTFLLIVIVPSLRSNGIKEKQNYYGKDQWICYTNNVSKGFGISVPVGVFALYFPRVIDNAYVNIVLLSLCLIVIALARIFLWRYEACICFDTQKVTVKYNRKRMEDKVLYISNFVTYKEKEGSHPAKLVFTGDEEIDLGFLREQRAAMVCKIVNRVKEEGELPDYYANLNALKELSTSITQRMEEADKAPENKPELSGSEYQEYLDIAFAEIPDDKKELLTKLVTENRKIEAIDECRKSTGESLRVAKDLIEKYFTQNKNQ